ncbi:Transcriptional regulator of acetoin/glycerol metabolism [Rhodoferax sp. OV413]|uniref:sigma-54-dependent Fis family transcriptional regulator n=1 Tax=Rhodoferax sp. OV413 TaxID=1855285 RepID=UPI00088F4E4C|nr:sigma-54-dependent Fis family transcriptional regulator [Rhodoferax sp. OV413]SDN92452.1 Transcriptional regulator of acetoin/glycerol metabolism [Rhodoferax sp. OV413]
MHSGTPPARTTSVALRQARRQLLDQGDVAPGLLDERLARSWGRSLDFGLQASGRTPGAPHASTAQLARALEQQRELVAHARPVMEFVFEQTRDSDCMVVLADSGGMLLHTLGDAEFLDRASRVALRPGATWHEQYRGTNAIGTAMAEQAPVVVHASEHYLERNSFLTCAAAPIHDPAGRLLGALDISGDHRGYHPHTLGLARSAARMIEHKLFETRHAGQLRLRFHSQMEGIGTVTECLLAVSPEGWVLGANTAALQWLGLGRDSIGRVQLEAVWPLAHALVQQPGPAAVRPLFGPRGGQVWLRVDFGRSRPAPLPRALEMAEPAPADALSALDTGDATFRAALDKARRVVGKPIALLLQGESGVGKEVFARAVHAAGPRRDGPFVAVNCAALPESLIEAELFGYSPGAFTGARREGSPGRLREAQGGTLLLDEVGDMPMAFQARLLRVLQERQVQPLGGGKSVALDFCLVCATHRQLREEMQAGRFREDLYYRINGLTLLLPPLRERSDQGALIGRLLGTLAPGQALQLAPELVTAFLHFSWPGNLRQLANVLRTACALLDEGETTIDWQHLPDDLAQDLREKAAPTDPGMDGPLRAQSVRTMERVLQQCNGNVSEAARQLGVSRNTLYRKLGASAAR